MFSYRISGSFKSELYIKTNISGYFPAEILSPGPGSLMSEQMEKERMFHSHFTPGIGEMKL